MEIVVYREPKNAFFVIWVGDPSVPNEVWIEDKKVVSKGNGFKYDTETNTWEDYYLSPKMMDRIGFNKSNWLTFLMVTGKSHLGALREILDLLPNGWQRFAEAVKKQYEEAPPG